MTRHLILLRHGETALSAAGVYAGNSDTSLTGEGRQQASAWFVGLNGIGGFHSPLARAAQTASLAGLDSVPDEQLTEWNLGALEGRSAEGFRSDHPEWSLFRDGAPGGESPNQVLIRADEVIARAASQQNDVTVLVGHGQFSKALATRLLHLPLKAAVRLAWGPGRAAVFSWRTSLGDYALAGWNRTPAPLSELIEGNA